MLQQKNSIPTIYIGNTGIGSRQKVVFSLEDFVEMVGIIDSAIPRDL